MNLYAVMRELGSERSTSAGITESLSGQVDAPSFMGHPYTCDGKQLAGLPAMCSPQQILGQVTDGELVQISDWIDVGAVHGG
jgi:branched-chain amino acid transport system substrate-binding protein